MARILTGAIATAGILALAVAAGEAPLAAASAPSGEAVFKANCAVCHSASPKGGPSIGPSLFGVYGRKSGTLAGYTYSTAMKNAGISWSEASLDKYIESPKKAVPGDKMPYAGMDDAAKRKALVQYLATLK